MYLSSPPLAKGGRGDLESFRNTVLFVFCELYMMTYNKELKQNSRNLRNNTTKAERHFWNKIRNKQFLDSQFYRQKIIGNYIVDFFCPKIKIIIELDGGQHYEIDKIDSDLIRDDYLNKLGYIVFRYSNCEILNNIDGVLEDLKNKVKCLK